MKMNQSRRVKILEILVDGTQQGNIHLDVNGEIKISKIKPKGNLWSYIKENTCMLNTQVRYSFEYEGYKSTLQRSIQKSLPNTEVIINEREISPEMEILYKKFLIKKDI